MGFFLCYNVTAVYETRTWICGRCLSTRRWLTEMRCTEENEPNGGKKNERYFYETAA